MIFAPDHARAAAELARVARQGGRLAFSAWTPEGSVGAAMGKRGRRPRAARRDVRLPIERRLSRFEAPSFDAAWQEFSTKFGPTKMLLDNLPPDRRAQFEQTMRDHFAPGIQPDGRVIDDREYLLVRGIRR